MSKAISAAKRAGAFDTAFAGSAKRAECNAPGTPTFYILDTEGVIQHKGFRAILANRRSIRRLSQLPRRAGQPKRVRSQFAHTGPSLRAVR